MDKMMVVHVRSKNNCIKVHVVSSIEDVLLEIIEDLFFDEVNFDEERFGFFEKVIINAGHVIFENNDDNDNNMWQIWVNKFELDMNNSRCDLVFKHDAQIGKYVLEDEQKKSFKFGSTKSKSIKFNNYPLSSVLQEYFWERCENEADEEYAQRTNIERFF